MWPLIDDKEGDWYPAGLPKKSVQGMEGYRVFLAMGLILVRCLCFESQQCESPSSRGRTLASHLKEPRARLFPQAFSCTHSRCRRTASTSWSSLVFCTACPGALQMGLEAATALVCGLSCCCS